MWSVWSKVLKVTAACLMDSEFSQTLWVSQKKMLSFKLFLFSENYCRNPDNTGGGPWCYVHTNGVRWDHCEVPWCPPVEGRQHHVQQLAFCRSTTVAFRWSSKQSACEQVIVGFWQDNSWRQLWWRQKWTNLNLCWTKSLRTDICHKKSFCKFHSIHKIQSTQVQCLIHPGKLEFGLNKIFPNSTRTRTHVVFMQHDKYVSSVVCGKWCSLECSHEQSNKTKATKCNQTTLLPVCTTFAQQNNCFQHRCWVQKDKQWNGIQRQGSNYSWWQDLWTMDWNRKDFSPWLWLGRFSLFVMFVLYACEFCVFSLFSAFLTLLPCRKLLQKSWWPWHWALVQQSWRRIGLL